MCQRVTFLFDEQPDPWQGSADYSIVALIFAIGVVVPDPPGQRG
jgi:hypothetical protein